MTYQNLTDYKHLMARDEVNYTYTGEPISFILPAGHYDITCYGAQGGYRTSSECGGGGAIVRSGLILKFATRVFIYVGGSGNNGGFNGGGIRDDGLPGGGGATDIRLGVDSLFSRVIVAGGGGSDGAANRAGGNGGGLTGVSSSSGWGEGGGGGAQTEGGIGANQRNDTFGTFGVGGNGCSANGGFGGAGGGGWYGGGGVYPDISSDDDRGGGGGSGYIFSSTSYKPEGYLLGDDSFTMGYGTVDWRTNTGDGRVNILVWELGNSGRFLARDTEGVKYWNGTCEPFSYPYYDSSYRSSRAETTGTSLTCSVSTDDSSDSETPEPISVIAAVSTQSSATFSEGWDIISRVEGSSASTSNLYVLHKKSVRFDSMFGDAFENITVTTEYSGLITVQMLSFWEVFEFKERWKTSTLVDAGSKVAVPDKPSKMRVLWVLCADTWQTSTPIRRWETTPSDLQSSSGSTYAGRLESFSDLGGDGSYESRNRTFTPYLSSTTGVNVSMIELTLPQDIDEGKWEYLSDSVSEDLFKGHGTVRMPRSMEGLVGDAEILCWTDDPWVVDNSGDQPVSIDLDIGAPIQTITQKTPLKIPDGYTIDNIVLVKDEQFNGKVSETHNIVGDDITFTYTLEKPTIGPIAGVKKINVYLRRDAT